MAVNYDISYINQNVSGSAEAFITACEAEFKRSVAAAVAAADARRCNLLMLAGPSSSGKTTTASLLASLVEQKGDRAYVVSLDDFYLNKGAGPKNADGTNDYESVRALDVAAIRQCLTELIRNRETDLPTFDFLTGTRRAETRHIALQQNDMLIIEGLHALHPLITTDLPQEKLLLAYISISSRICAENEIYLNKRDLRFLRRMVRDFHFRASSPAETFEIWPRVLRGEEQYLFPFEDRAQLRINSLHPYEPCVLAGAAVPLLAQIPVGSPYFEKATRLSAKLQGFPFLDAAAVPADSLLREFLG